MMKSKGYKKGGMKSKGYAKGGTKSDGERRQSVSNAIKTIKSFGGAMTDGERKMLEGLLNKPSKKSMGGSMKTKGYAKGGPYQGQRQQYKRTGNV